MNIRPKNDLQTMHSKAGFEQIQRLSRLQLLDPSQTVLFTRLRGGMTNQVYLIEQGETRIIVKVYDVCTTEPNPLYPNSALVESHALSHLAHLEIAPRKLASWHGKRVDNESMAATLAYEYLNGQTWQSDTATVAKLLSRLHNPTTLPPPVWLRRLPLSAHDVCAQGDKILQRLSIKDAASLQQLRPKQPSQQQVSEKCFVHGDCWAGNIIQSDEGLRLIDWQCPGVGDAVEDIANFLSPGMMSFCRDETLSDTEQAVFFHAYENDDVVERYQRDAASWHWRLACYYLYRRESLRGSQAKLAAGYARALEKEIHFIKHLR